MEEEEGVEEKGEGEMGEDSLDDPLHVNVYNDDEDEDKASESGIPAEV